MAARTRMYCGSSKISEATLQHHPPVLVLECKVDNKFLKEHNEI